MYINSPGGSVYAGLGIYDTMQFISPDVATICTGMAASMGAILLCAGVEGKRTALKHSRIMLHQPSGAIGGQASNDGFSVNANVKLNQNIMAPQVQVNQQAMQSNNSGRLAELKSIRQARESSVQYLQELESVVKQMTMANRRRRNHQSADV